MQLKKRGKSVPSLFVLLPCYNEQQNIEALLVKWQNLADSLVQSGYILRIVCIDDGSNDHTKKIIQKFTCNSPNITLLLHEENRGLGEALKTGLKYFNENSKRGDLALVMDADNTHEPKYVFSMLETIKNGFDCVIASRYQTGSSLHGVPSHRHFFSDGAKIYYSLILRVPNVRDYTCGYRMYSQEIINNAFLAYNDRLITQKGFTCMMELLYKLYTVKAKFAEIPFELHYDYKLGQSKMKLAKTIITSLLITIYLRFKYHQKSRH